MTTFPQTTARGPGCDKNHLDLSAEAFAKIADPKAGRVPITYQVVACNVSEKEILGNDPQAAMAFCAVQNVDVEGAAQKQRPRKPCRRRVEQAAEKARPIADAKGVRREMLHIGKPVLTRSSRPFGASSLDEHAQRGPHH